MALAEQTGNFAALIWNDKEVPDMSINNKERGCKAKTRSGRRCRAAAMKGGLCFFHANPDKAVELGRIGGRKNRHVALESGDSLPDLNTARGVREANKRLSEYLYNGKMDPRIAASLVRSLSLQLRAIETSDTARQLAEVQKELRLLADAFPSWVGSVAKQTTEDFKIPAVRSTKNGENMPIAPPNPVPPDQSREAKKQ
ncbi:MAG: hypothetical protein WA609_04635 [Terriglobales bacterium]